MSTIKNILNTITGNVEQPPRFPAARSLGDGIASAALGEPLLGEENQRRVSSHKRLAVEIPGATIRAVGIGEPESVEGNSTRRQSRFLQPQYMQVVAHAIVVTYVAEIEVFVILRHLL